MFPLILSIQHNLSQLLSKPRAMEDEPHHNKIFRPFTVFSMRCRLYYQHHVWLNQKKIVDLTIKSTQQTDRNTLQAGYSLYETLREIARFNPIVKKRLSAQTSTLTYSPDIPVSKLPFPAFVETVKKWEEEFLNKKTNDEFEKLELTPEYNTAYQKGLKTVYAIVTEKAEEEVSVLLPADIKENKELLQRLVFDLAVMLFDPEQSYIGMDYVIHLARQKQYKLLQFIRQNEISVNNLSYQFVSPICFTDPQQMVYHEFNKIFFYTSSLQSIERKGQEDLRFLRAFYHIKTNQNLSEEEKDLASQRETILTVVKEYLTTSQEWFEEHEEWFEEHSKIREDLGHLGNLSILVPDPKERMNLAKLMIMSDRNPLYFDPVFFDLEKDEAIALAAFCHQIGKPGTAIMTLEFYEIPQNSYPTKIKEFIQSLPKGTFKRLEKGNYTSVFPEPVVASLPEAMHESLKKGSLYTGLIKMDQEASTAGVEKALHQLTLEGFHDHQLNLKAVSGYPAIYFRLSPQMKKDKAIVQAYLKACPWKTGMVLEQLGHPGWMQRAIYLAQFILVSDGFLQPAENSSHQVEKFFHLLKKVEPLDLIELIANRTANSGSNIVPKGDLEWALHYVLHYQL